MATWVNITPGRSLSSDCVRNIGLSWQSSTSTIMPWNTRQRRLLTSSNFSLKNKILYLMYLPRKAHLARTGFFANLPEVVSPLVKTISRFCKAADSVTRSAASSAVSWDTPSVNITPMETQQRSSLMAGQPGQRSLMAPSVQQMAKNFVLTTTSVEVMPSVFTPMVFEHISAHTVALSPTTRSPGSAGRILDNRPMPNEDSSHSLSISKFLPYRDFSSTIVHRDPSMIADKDSSEFSDNIFLRIIIVMILTHSNTSFPSMI